jgi:hypothetical protein
MMTHYVVNVAVAPHSYFDALITNVIIFAHSP